MVAAVQPWGQGRQRRSHGPARVKQARLDRVLRTANLMRNFGPGLLLEMAKPNDFAVIGAQSFHRAAKFSSAICSGLSAVSGAASKAPCLLPDGDERLVHRVFGGSAISGEHPRGMAQQRRLVAGVEPGKGSPVFAGNTLKSPFDVHLRALPADAAQATI